MSYRIVVVVACAVLLAACGEQQQGGPRENVHKGRDPSLDQSGGGFSLFGPSKKQDDQGGGMAVNAYLWRGALDTLKFMPLASADPFGGVIITDWWTPPTSTSERFKATTYVLSRQLRADGIRVSLFRQVLENGQWVDAPVDPSKPTELENMVLDKARQLRSQTTTAQ